jgi:hypothetical protein
LIGPGIQGNPHKLIQHDLYVYDIYLIDKQCHASFLQRKEIMDSSFLRHVRSVPLVDLTRLSGYTVDSLLNMAENEPDQINPDNKTPEGLVFKHTSGSPTFKVISNKYLIKEK